MVEVTGILRVWDFIPEELEIIYYALRYYRLRGALWPEQEALARRIEDAIETWLRD